MELTGYIKFVKGYANLSKASTEIEERRFDKAHEAFTSLKTLLVTAPVLTVPDFEKQFVVETNASK